MSRFSGPQHKGAMAEYRLKHRQEAETRQLEEFRREKERTKRAAFARVYAADNQPSQIPPSVWLYELLYMELEKRLKRIYESQD